MGTVTAYTEALRAAERELHELESRRALLIAAIESWRPLAEAELPRVQGAGQQAILGALTSGPLTVREIVERTGGSPKTIEPALTRLKARGVIEHVKTDKRGGYWCLPGARTEARP